MSTRARTTDGSWKRTVVLGAMKSSVIKCVQLYPEVGFHRRVIVAVSQRTLPIMLLTNEKKEKKKKTNSDRESNLVVIFRVLIIVYRIT